MKKYQKKTLINLILTIVCLLLIPIFLLNPEPIILILLIIPGIISVTIISLVIFQFLSSTILSFLLSLYLAESEYELYHEIASKSYKECLFMDNLDDISKEMITEIKEKVETYLKVHKVLRFYYNHFVQENFNLFVTGD